MKNQKKKPTGAPASGSTARPIKKPGRKRLGTALCDFDDKLFRLAEKAFGSTAGARSWLVRPAFGLGGKIPIIHARTLSGKQAVALLLKRIDRGVLP
jgi:hypothetical protein